MPLYQAIALKAREWNTYGNIGLVVGATYPDELKIIRELNPQMPLLIPGIGAQGGDLALTIKNGIDTRGEKTIIAVSRQILYTSIGKDFAQKARHSAHKLRENINKLASQIINEPK